MTCSHHLLVSSSRSVAKKSTTAAASEAAVTSMGMQHGSIVFSHHLRSRLKVTCILVSHLCVEPSVTAFIAETHVTSMRLIASIARQHFEGSNQAARMLKREKKISSATDWRLDCMATTYFVSEHTDVVMCNDFSRPFGTPRQGNGCLSLGNATKNSSFYKCIGGGHQLAPASGTLPARGRF